MKKILALLTVIAMLTVICAGCAPAENTPTDAVQPGSSEGAPIEDTTAPTTEQTQTPTENSAEDPTGATIDVESAGDSKPTEDSGNNTEISFDDLLANS